VTRVSRTSTLVACIAIAGAAFVYAGGYTVARSQDWIVHYVGRYEPTDTVAGHALAQGRASGEIGGVEGIVPAQIEGSPLADAWIAGWMHSHRVYAPLMWAEETAWEVFEPYGARWPYP
jgi:hypothetical protein